MKTKTKIKKCFDKKNFKDHCSSKGSSGGAIYGIGIFGALFYFLQGATTLTAIVVGVFKSIAWPAFLLFKVLTILQL